MQRGGRSRTPALRKVRVTHQESITLARRAAPFVEGPHDETLAAAAVASREDIGEVGLVFTVVGFEIGARVALKSRAQTRAGLTLAVLEPSAQEQR